MIRPLAGKVLDGRGAVMAATNIALLAALTAVLVWPLPQEQQPVAGYVPPSPSKAPQQPFAAASPALFGRVAMVTEARSNPPARPTDVSPPTPATLQPLQWRVTGIIIPASSRAVALLERKSGAAQIMRANVGTKVEDWIVEGIAARSVSFRRGDTLVEVLLDSRQ